MGEARGRFMRGQDGPVQRYERKLCPICEKNAGKWITHKGKDICLKCWRKTK